MTDDSYTDQRFTARELRCLRDYYTLGTYIDRAVFQSVMAKIERGAGTEIPSETATRMQNEETK